MSVSHLLQLLLLLILILVAAKGAGSLSTRLGQPAVLGEILVGLLLGPTVLDLLGRGLFQGGRAGDPLHPDLAGVVHDLAQIVEDRKSTRLNSSHLVISD